MRVSVLSVLCAVSCVLSSSVALKQKAPNGGYRLEAQESRNAESETYRQQPPALRPSEHYSTDSRLESPLSYQIPDDSPWRPMVSESTSRVHKTSFGKGFKYHSFADPKAASEESHDGAEAAEYSGEHQIPHPQILVPNSGSDSKNSPNHHDHHQNPHHYHSQQAEQPHSVYHADSGHQSYVSNNPYTPNHEQPRNPQYIQRTQTAATNQREQQNAGGVQYIYVQEPAEAKANSNSEQHQQQQQQQYPPYDHHHHHHSIMSSQYEQHHGQQQTKEEEPSDDVLLAHIPLPKAKIAVEMHDDEHSEGAVQKQHEAHNYPDQQSEQEHAGNPGNAGPVYHVVNQEEEHNSASKNNVAATRGQPLEFEFRPHFTRHVPTNHHHHQIPPRTRVPELQNPHVQSHRTSRQFTIRASPLRVPSQQVHFVHQQPRQEPTRTLTSHFTRPRAFNLGPHYEAVIATPPALRTTFQRARLHHEQHPKPFFMPLMFSSVNNGAREERIFRLPEAKGFAQTTFPYLDGSGGSGPTAGLDRMPLTRDIQAYIKKKAAA